MREAHQGVPVADLPTDNGGFLAGMFNRREAVATNDALPPRPPAAVQPAANAPAPRGRGLDGWLLNNLFGRR
jgi:hypothetical protein